MKFDSSNLSEGFSTRNGALSFITQKPAQAQRILPMIEERIRDEVEPRAQQAEKDLIVIIDFELVKLGINPDLTSLYSSARGIADQYREQLVGKRMEALVSSLVAASGSK